MKTLALDFDGVLAAYSGWKGPDKVGAPLEGAIAFLERMSKHYQLVIHSTREPKLIAGWLEQYCPQLVDKIDIAREKPPAWLSIDDRALCFKGVYPTANQIDAFRPWWQAEDLP
jgi:hypothetical protein